MKKLDYNIHTHKIYIKYDGDMARRMIIRDKNGNNITTERPVKNRHRHVPKHRSCPSAGQTTEMFTAPINLWSRLNLV